MAGDHFSFSLSTLKLNLILRVTPVTREINICCDFKLWLSMCGASGGSFFPKLQYLVIASPGRTMRRPPTMSKFPKKAHTRSRSRHEALPVTLAHNPITRYPSCLKGKKHYLLAVPMELIFRETPRCFGNPTFRDEGANQ